MISAFDVYLVNKADDIITTCSILMVVCGLFFFLLAILYFCTEEEEDKLIATKSIKSVSIIFSISLLIYTIIPSTNTLYQMLIVPKFANSEFAKQLPDYLNQYIKNELIKNEKK